MSVASAAGDSPRRQDNMYFYNGKRVMVVGDDSIRDASLGVSGNYD